MNTSERIELYLSGNMNQAQLDEMKELINADNNLASEIDLQKSIIESIKLNRKLALKASLNSIPSSAILEFAAQTVRATYLKIAAMVVGSVFTLGVVTYFVNKKVSEPAQTTTNLNELETKSIEPTKDASIIENKIIETVGTNPKLEIDSKKITINSKTVKIENKLKSKKLATKAKSAETNRSFLDNKFESESETVVKSDLKENKEFIASGQSSKTAEIDITSIKDDKHKFHYSKKENLLSLYGDFDDSPYEILELNDSSGQVMYLYYKNTYYSLRDTKNGGIEKLKKIYDEKTIQDLVKARKH
jgi:hypothetical protein